MMLEAEGIIVEGGHYVDKTSRRFFAIVRSPMCYLWVFRNFYLYVTCLDQTYTFSNRTWFNVSWWYTSDSKGEAMIKVCAWCKKELSRDDREPKDKISHSICLACKEKLLSREFEVEKE